MLSKMPGRLQRWDVGPMVFFTIPTLWKNDNAWSQDNITPCKATIPISLGLQKNFYLETFFTNEVIFRRRSHPTIGSHTIFFATPRHPFPSIFTIWKINKTTVPIPSSSWASGGPPWRPWNEAAIVLAPNTWQKVIMSKVPFCERNLLPLCHLSCESTNQQEVPESWITFLFNSKL